MEVEELEGLVAVLWQAGAPEVDDKSEPHDSKDRMFAVAGAVKAENHDLAHEIADLACPTHWSREVRHAWGKRRAIVDAWCGKSPEKG